MNITITYDNEKPLYEQVVDSISQAIYNNQIDHNEMLPSVRQLAADLNVSAITTKRAYAELEQLGLIYTIPGKGTFVKANNLTEIVKKRKQKISDEIKNKVLEGFEAGLSKEEIEEIIENVYGGKKDE